MVCCPTNMSEEGGKVIKNIGEKKTVVEEEVTPSSNGLRGGFEKDKRKSITREGKLDKEDARGFFMDEFPVYGEWHQVSEEFQ